MSTISPTNGDHHGRPSRLSRRQSYDPLSSGKAPTATTPLSLGDLPAPQFGTMPAGQRSVPAVDSARFPGGLPFKSSASSSTMSAAVGDGQRTPGGSLVIGAELFGFGPSSAKTGGSSLKDTWTPPDVAALTGAKDDKSNDSNWPTEFNTPLASLNGERPGLKSFGSSIDLRPTGMTLAHDSNRPQRPSAIRSKTSMALETAAPGEHFAGSSHTILPSTVKQPRLSDLPSTSVPSLSQVQEVRSVDELTNGLRATTLSEELNASPSHRVTSSIPSRPPVNQYNHQQQQQPFGFGEQHHQPPPPQQLQQQPPQQYSSYDPASYFAGPGVDAFGHRRDSGYGSTPGTFGPPGGHHSAQQVYRRSPPVWNVPPAAYAMPADYAAQIHSTPSSRNGSFSYGSTPTAYPPYAAMGPSALYGSPVDAGSPVFGSAALMAPRGMRGPLDYIAPGPPGAMTGYPPWAMMPDVARMMRGPLLEEFRNNRQRDWELADIIGHVVEFSGDQLGSRHIQQKLESATAEEKQRVFDEILPNILQLSTDVFANYVVQKFFEQGSQAQKAAMAKMLEGHVLQLSLQMYGCRVIQKAIEHVLVEQQVRIVKELDGHILRCSRDAQANHVVQRALERVPPEHLNFITDACLGQVHALATHPYGCRVLQRIFENCPPEQSRELLDELQRFSHNLIQDQYGNYVIQWVIEKGNPADRSLVISKTYGQMLPLSQQKFSSNVMEKCIQYGTEDERHRLIEEIMQTLPDGSTVVKAMLTHPYANYVMQKILNYVQGEQRGQLFEMTSVELANLRKYSTTYSKHLLAIEKLLSTERGGRPF